MGRQSQLNSLPRDPLDFLTGAFGPLAPIKPIGVDQPPKDSERPEPRRWQYPVAWNMPVGVPGSEGLKLADFATLRLYSEIYSVARACVQLRKDEILGIGWDIGPTNDASKAMRNDRVARKDFGERRAELLRFFRRPDPNYNDFTTWLEAVLEDILVVDALSIYLHPARLPGKGILGSDLAALDLIAGDTIRPLLDLRGGSPAPPNPAYQQYLYGVPRSDMMTILTGEDVKDMDAPAHTYRGDQLLYLPRNPRSWTPYGQSPLERCIVPVITGLRRQQYQMDFYLEGCHDHLSEILTRQGWKRFEKLDDNDEVATLSAAGAFEWQQPSERQCYAFNGNLLHFKSKSMDLMVTPNHRMYARRKPQKKQASFTRWNSWHFREANYFAEHPSAYFELPAASEWRGTEAPAEFTLPGMPERRLHSHGNPRRAWSEIKIPMPAFCKFLGLYIAEGWTQQAGSSDKDHSMIFIAQVATSRHLHEMQEALAALGLSYGYDAVNSKFMITNLPLARWLRENCGFYSYDKHVPDGYKDLAPELLEQLLRGLMIGDGFWGNGHRNQLNTRHYTTCSRQLADDVQEIFQKLGSNAWIDENEPTAGKYAGQKTKRIIYVVHERQAKTLLVQRPVLAEYHGNVYCVTVPNGVVLTRRNGKLAWTGNSIPGMFLSVGDPDMTPNQMREFQDTMNALAGDQAWKHKIVVVPAGSKFDPMKPPELSDQTDEVLMTQVLMAYSVMPMELGILPKIAATQTPSAAMQMAKAQQDITERKTLKPDLLWLKNALFDKVIQGVCGQHDMEWRWDGLEEDKDELTATNLLTEQISFGLTSIDEARIEIGRDPWGLEITQDPGWATAAGFLPLGAINPDTGMPRATEGLQPNGVPAIPGSPAGSSRSGTAKPGQGSPSGPMKRPASSTQPNEKPLGRRPQSPGHDAAAAGEASNRAKPRPAPKAAMAELDALCRHLRKGREITTWEARHLPESILAKMSEGLAGGLTLETVAAIAQTGISKIIDGEALKSVYEQWDEDVVPDTTGIDPEWADNDPGGAPQPGGLPVKPPRKPVRKSGNAAYKVANQLEEDYPDQSLAWVLHDVESWTGPVEVPLEKIDFDNRQKWNAWHERDRIRQIAAKQARKESRGKHLKPAVMVQVPGKEEYRVIDGHHRSLAGLHNGKPVWAWVGKTSKVKGPWDEFHAFQRTEGSGGSEFAAA
jgi:hypothetical protein